MAKKKPVKGRASKSKKARQFRAAAAKRRNKLTPKAKLARRRLDKGVALKLSPKLSKKIEDQNRKAESLLVRGRERGFVTYDEILKAFPNIETDVDFLEVLYEKFSTAHIDVLEGGGMLEIQE